MPRNPADQIDLIYGEVTQHAARVYAHTPVPDISIRGHITGPFCAYSSTLPTTSEFRPVATRNGSAAEVAVPDPCTWTPDLPATYKVRLECRQADASLHCEQEIGLRTLGVRGRNLWFESKRWVLRGAFCTSVNGTDLSAWREAGAVMLVTDPDKSLLEAASRVGVLLCVQLSPQHNTHERRRQIAQYPAAACLLMSAGTVHDWSKSQTPNLLAGQLLSADEEPADWSDFIVLPVDEPRRFAEQARALDRPVIASRQLASPQEIHRARAACDDLQRTLAPHIDLAGYVV